MLHAAFDDAVTRGLVVWNPVSAAEPPSLRAARSREAERIWTAPQLLAFLEHVAGGRFHAMWLLFTATGMRRGEVVGLPWPAVDLDAGVLEVVQQLTTVNGAAVWEDHAKSAAGDRRIALDAGTVAALRTTSARQAAERLACGTGWHDHPWGPLVVCWPDGRQLHPHTPGRHLHRHADALGLPRIPPHGLRHSYATAALQAGVRPDVLAERLGHANVATTLSTYAHVSRDDHADAARRVAEWIGVTG